MSEDNFDKEVSQLYRQRKNEIIAPNFDVNIHSKVLKNRLSLSKALAIVLVGSAASFGIFAIISHLAKTPQVIIGNPIVNHAVELKEIPAVEVTNKSIVVKQSLPPKPIITEPINTKALPPQVQSVPNEFSELDLASVPIQVVTIPKIKEPKLILKPIYKVMPKYSGKAMQANEIGTIRLRYEINIQGKVDNIEVVKSTLGRGLQKSAKKALAQWQYPPNEHYKASYEIIFEFNRP